VTLALVCADQFARLRADGRGDLLDEQPFAQLDHVLLRNSSQARDADVAEPALVPTELAVGHQRRCAGQLP
jgi:hypothetical protein